MLFDLIIAWYLLIKTIISAQGYDKFLLSAVEMHAEMLDWNVHASVPLSGDMFTG